jgi:hypothetical protein
VTLSDESEEEEAPEQEKFLAFVAPLVEEGVLTTQSTVMKMEKSSRRLTKPSM